MLEVSINHVADRKHLKAIMCPRAIQEHMLSLLKHM